MKIHGFDFPPEAEIPYTDAGTAAWQQAVAFQRLVNDKAGRN